MYKGLLRTRARKPSCCTFRCFRRACPRGNRCCAASLLSRACAYVVISRLTFHPGNALQDRRHIKNASSLKLVPAVTPASVALAPARQAQTTAAPPPNPPKNKPKNVVVLETSFVKKKCLENLKICHF